MHPPASNQKPEPLRLGLIHVRHLLRHGRSLDMLPTIQLLVQADQQEPQRSGRRNSHDRRPAVHAKRNRVPRRVLCVVHVRSVDGGGVARGVDEGEGGGALRGRAREGV